VLDRLLATLIDAFDIREVFDHFSQMAQPRTQPTAPDGHGTESGIPVHTISSPSAAQALVDELIAQGADFIGEIVYDDGKSPACSSERKRTV
jgi:hypothetical protein